MDGYARFVTTYLLTPRAEGEVNRFMQQYIAWAERQHRKRVETVVMREWNDEEPDNRLVKQWYEQKGIVHKKVDYN
ncbi:hypothetical protein DVH05_017029 [Phytophthora capsici]|nr:hypothetical protein DVH05_017029 [Phytophthora capsici]